MKNSKINVEGWENLYSEMLTFAKFTYSLGDGKVYLSSFFLSAVIKRSLVNIKTFEICFEQELFSSIGATIRMQLDSLIRTFGGYLVNDKDTYYKKFLDGARLNQSIAAETGKPLTENYIVKKLSEFHPWINTVYSFCSGYIHLSDKHLHNAMKLEADGSGKFNLALTHRDTFVSPEDYIEAVRCFEEISILIPQYILGWCPIKAKWQAGITAYKSKS